MVRSLILVALFSLLATPTNGQSVDGIVMTQRVTSGGGPFTIRTQITATRMRTEMAGPNGVLNETIFDGSAQVLYIVDPARKTYMEITKADVGRLSAQMQGAVSQIQGQLKTLPPAERAQMEAMMKGVQQTRTGSEEVGRWTCEKYDLTMGGQKLGETCSLNPAALGFRATDFDVMLQMGAFYSAMAPLMPAQLAGATGINQPGGSGFAVKTVLMVPGGTMTTELVEAGRATFPEELFAVPAGFTKQDLPAAMGGAGAQR